MKFNLTALYETLVRLQPEHQQYVLAFSGGVDSHVLLHALAALRAEHPGIQLRAIHLHHGLSKHADYWQVHCQAVCSSLHVPFEAIKLSLPRKKGESVEAAARIARYRALKMCLQNNECLLTAHHQDDQVETFLLQCFRGAGLSGLKGMLENQTFGRGFLMRPLLEFSRDDLLQYAQMHQLHWIEDESNTNRQFRRNFLRHDIIPLLKNQWPALNETVSRTVKHCQSAYNALSMQAMHRLQALRHEEHDTLIISKLLLLPVEERQLIIREWIREKKLSMPSVRKMQHILSDVIEAGADAMPCVQWANVEARRYRDELYIAPQLPFHDSSVVVKWDINQPLMLPAGMGTLTIERKHGAGIRIKASDDITVIFRAGGERVKLAGHRMTHSVKKLLQAWAVPPWLRDRVPLIAINGVIAQIGQYAVCEGFNVDKNEAGFIIKGPE